MFWKRIGRSSDKVLDAEVLEREQALEQAAAKRLGRLVSRQRDEEAAATSVDEGAAQRIAGYYADCAFLTLGVPVSATPSEIARMVDDLSFAEDVDPQALAQAQAELLSPRDRLAHELAWLPGCDAPFQHRAAIALKSGDCDAVAALRLSASGLARINLGCALLAARPADAACLAALLADLAQWQLHECHGLVDEARMNAGLRPAEPAHFDAAATARLEIVADRLAGAAAATREGRLALANAIATHAETIRSADNPALEAVIAAYAREVDPKLQNLQAKIDEAIASLKADPQQPARLTSIITMLDLWSQFRMPMQRLEQARGLDDPLSARLFGALRDLGIELANTHDLQSETLRLAHALKHAFAAVPGLQPLIERDMPTLLGNVLSVRLVSLTKDALQHLGKFADELRSFGLEGECGPRTAQLLDCFQQWHEVQPQAEEPFLVMRELIIALNNKASAPALAIRITEWLLSHHVPQSVVARLTQDMCQLQQNINRKK